MKSRINSRILIYLFLSVIFFLQGTILSGQAKEAPFLKYMNNAWVDSVMKTLTLDQKIAQCIWIAGYSNRDIAHETDIIDQIRKYGVGGIVFFQGTAAKQAELTNFYQSIAKVPLIISLDAEWGVGMRLANIDRFPYQMTLGSISNDSLIYRFGGAVADQFLRLGMQVNFAPVLDINVNAANPVINYRSFGESKNNVTSKGLMYMKGMQDRGILATGKHFPGHGDTNVDSHLDLPVISHPRQRLDTLELYPFRQLIGEGIGSIMVAHLNLPSLDTTSSLPSTLSKSIITGLLRNDLKFNGLIVTDAMMMKAVTKYFRPGEADAKALEAGNDVAEFVTDVEATIRETKNYIALKRLSEADIDLKCRKVLALKYWSGLNKIRPIKTENIDKQVSPAKSRALIYELYENAITVLRNKEDILPLRNAAKLKIATVGINSESQNIFQKRINDYYPADNFIAETSDSLACRKLLAKLKNYDLVIAGVTNLDQRPNMDFGLTTGIKRFIGELTSGNKTIISWFGNPYGIARVKELENAAGLILSYQENDFVMDLSAQLIFGAIAAKGHLPVTINATWQAGFGIATEGGLRLKYEMPENPGVSSEYLNHTIDSIAERGLEAHAYPGCVVMAARNGNVIFRKAYGYQTYDKRIPVDVSDLYDLASVTKISSTLAGLMLLNSEGKFNPDKTLGDYLPYFRKSDKGPIPMRDFLTHQAGLTPYISFWKETLRPDGTYKHGIFSPVASKKYPDEVATGLYINKNFRKKMFSEIRKSKLGEKKYVYSDLTFIIAPSIIETITGTKWNEFVSDNIYKKIGAMEMGFNPYKRFAIDRIVPTEYDSLFRKQLLHGTVHDEGAAMLGGISGHAGLFANANDLMKLMELYRRKGNYAGLQIINSNIIDEYARVQFPGNNNRRGLGFDKPMINNASLPEKDSYPCKSASADSFGHSGYTGTFVWVDPDAGITYVFLCNRVYPTRKSEELYNLNIRTSILQAIYDSIK